MPSLPSYITIDEVISEFMLQRNYKPQEYAKIYKLCLSIIRSINFFEYPIENKTVKLEMNANLIVDLPSDFVSLIRLGVPINGKIYVFTNDEGIITTTTEVNGVETLDINYGEGVDINPPYSYGLGAKGGRNTEGYYKIDYDRKRIVFRNVKRSEVLLEYATTGVTLDGETYIPAILTDLIKASLAYELIRYDINVPAYLKEDYLRQLQDEKRKVKMITLPSLQDIVDAYYGGSTIANIR